MSEPEIARRCTACGASIRERAFFCPQCGNTMPDKPKTTAELVQSDPDVRIATAEPASAEVENEMADVEPAGETDPEIPEPGLMTQAVDAISTEIEAEAAGPESASREVEAETAIAETTSTEIESETVIAEPGGSAELPDDVETDVAPLNDHSLSPRETLAAPWPDRDVPLRPRPRQYPEEPDKRHRLQRAAAGAREAFDDGAQRVERIRKISSVVIDQASYDPSLRFVLVAAGLFILFLTILILSKLIG